MNNVYKLTLDIKRQQNVTIHRTVVGDTAVIFEIKVTDGGVPVLLDAVLNKVIAVFERPDHAVYTQDKDTGVSFVDGTSTVTIAVSPASFRAGRNTIELQIYTREQETDEVYPDLVTTEKGIFNARAATLRSDAPNAPSQLPMLEQLIADATAAVAAANAAITAANAAAEAANAAADFAHDEGLLADEKAQDAAAAASAANVAAALVKLNGMPYLLTAKDVTHPTATSIDCGVEQTYAEVMATHTDTVYRPLCIVLDGYLLYERSYQKNGDAGLTVTMTADTGMGTSINATLVAQSRFGGLVGITALYESASSDTGGYGNGLYVVHHGGQEQDSSASSDAGEYDYGFTTMTEESKGDILAAMNAGAALAYVYNDYHNERDITFYETNRYTETRQRFNSTTMETETYEVTIVRMTLYDREGAYDGYAELGISDSNTVYVSGAYKAQFVEVV